MATSTTSYTKTPQAGDDNYSYTENDFDLTGSILLDVMSNDLGGKAKALYSIDDGDNALSDLLQKDPSLTTNWEYTSENNLIRINNGKIEYKLAFDADGLNTNGYINAAGEFVAYAEGQTAYTDSFVYAVKLGNGTLSYATVNISLTGTNDAATISGDTSKTVSETNEILQVTGTLTADDVDNADNIFKPVSDQVGEYGTLSMTEAGVWTFTANSAFNELNTDSAPLVSTFEVESIDGTPQTITVTINGTNDAAIISGDTSKTVTETNEILRVTGTLTADDVDNADDTFKLVTDLAGDYGTLSMTAAGVWTFTANSAFDELNTDTSYVDTFEVESIDGTPQTITITINGTNDAAVIAGDSTGTVTEDAAINQVGGTLRVDDPDSLETFSTPASLSGTYGSFTFNPATGTWTYTLDNTRAVTQALTSTSNVTDSLTVTSTDGTASITISVTINGANEAPAVVTVATVYSGNDDPNDMDEGIAGGTTTNGTANADSINGTNTDDTNKTKLQGFTGDDKIAGLAGDDDIQGMEGVDTIYGGEGNDNINGGPDNDVLFGGSGSDSIKGTDGDDLITGGYGADNLSGAGGKDTFIFLSTLDTGDTITDFNDLGDDIINLSAIDANVATADTNDTFAWGDQSNGLVANGVTWHTSGANVIVWADTDGNLATAELEIILTGTTSIAESDFVL